MNIALDTSIFRKDRKLENFDLLLLKKLSKLNLIKIHIPWIVYKESTSHNFIDTNTTIDKMTKDLQNFDKRGIAFREVIVLRKISKQLKSINLFKSVEDHWKEFINESNAILHPLDNTHGEIVMLSYFNGDKPFPVAKSRKDIPDAFIYQALITISKSYSPIIFIAEDKNLREACNLINNINSISSFDELYKLKEYEPIEKKYKEIEHYIDELIIVEENIEDIRKIAITKIHGEIFNEMIIEAENIPADNNEATVVRVFQITTLDTDKTKIQFVDNNFYIPVEGNGRFTLEYFLFKADYYILDNRNISIIDSDWNKHYYNVVEDFDFDFSFKFKLNKEDVDDIKNIEVEDIKISNIEIIRPK